MKKATILPLCMAVVLSTSMVSGITAFANPLPPQIHNTQDDDPGVTPYYLYIQTLDVMVEPGLQFAPHGGHWCVCQRPPGGAQRPPSLRYFDRLNNNNVMLRCPLHNSVG